jgi:uncharacterized coiled-coil protein SlyX
VLRKGFINAATPACRKNPEQTGAGRISPIMSDRVTSELEVVVARLRAEQDVLLLDAEADERPPCQAVLQRIVELETKIQSVEDLIEDR